jgi:hypothetical protein
MLRLIDTQPQSRRDRMFIDRGTRDCVRSVNLSNLPIPASTNLSANFRDRTLAVSAIGRSILMSACFALPLDGLSGT